MKDIEDSLRQLKEAIGEAKSDRANLEGRLSEQMKGLKDEFGCSSEEEGKELVESLKKKKTRAETRARKGLKELQEEYDW